MIVIMIVIIRSRSCSSSIQFGSNFNWEKMKKVPDL